MKHRDFLSVSRFRMTGGVSSVVNICRPSSILITLSVGSVYSGGRSRRNTNMHMTEFSRDRCIFVNKLVWSKNVDNSKRRFGLY